MFIESNADVTDNMAFVEVLKSKIPLTHNAVLSKIWFALNHANVHIEWRETKVKEVRIEYYVNIKHIQSKVK